jgi:hypothetical protein
LALSGLRSRVSSNRTSSTITADTAESDVEAEKIMSEIK